MEFLAIQFELNHTPIVTHPHYLFRQIIDNGCRICFLRAGSGYSCLLHPLFGQLGLNVECADTIYFVSKEVQTIWVIVRVTIYIHYSSSDGVLSGLIDEVHTFKVQFCQLFAQGC